MKFEEALKEYRNGKKIDVSESNKVKFLEGKIWELQKLFDLDWVVIEEPGKTFCEVFEDFKKGKKIRRKWWHESSYISKNGGLGIFSSNDALSNDWEVVDE